MSAANSYAIDELLSKSDDHDDYTPEGRPGRKPGSAKSAQPKAALRNNQAWRAIEDMKENRRLDRNLREIYEEE